MADTVYYGFGRTEAAGFSGLWARLGKRLADYQLLPADAGRARRAERPRAGRPRPVAAAGPRGRLRERLRRLRPEREGREGRPGSRPAFFRCAGSERHAVGGGDEAGDDVLGAGLLEVDGELVALDGGDGAVAELLVEDAGAGVEGRRRRWCRSPCCAPPAAATCRGRRRGPASASSRGSCRRRPWRRCRRGSEPRGRAGAAAP